MSLTVRDVMATSPLTLTEETDILHALERLLDRHLTGAPVVDRSGHLTGVLSERHCLRLVSEGDNGNVPRGTVGEFMSRDFETLSPDVNVHYAAGVFLNASYRRLPVVEAGKLVGVVSRADILRVVEGVLLTATI